jgi:clan AA aspartic protease (TIGR02281 family)
MRLFRNLLVLFGLLISQFANSQTIIKMQEENGIYTMPCEVNGLKLRFIFDTGASDISLSITEAVFMLKNGYLDKNDLVGTTQYSIANGDIAEGTTINLKEVTIGNLKLHNVEASILHSLEAPLLFGQSALNKLGKIEFDYSKNILTINNGSTTEFYMNPEGYKTIKSTPQNLNYYTFKKLPRQEQTMILKNSNLAYQEYRKYLNLKRTGIAVLGVGSGVIITGIVLDAVQNAGEVDENWTGYNNTGGNFAAVGAGIAAVGIGVWALAPKKMKNAVYYYNQEHNFSLNLNPTLNGLELTLNF